MGTGTILLVDDDIDIVETLQTLLGLAGFQVMVATDGRQALTVLDKVGWPNIDLVITDMVMPELDGLGFLRIYAAHPATRAPVLAMSSLEAYLDAAARLGAAATLRKPFEIRDFMEQVRSLIAGGQRGGRLASKSSDQAERRRLAMIDDLRLEAPDVATLFHSFVERVAATFEVPTCLLSIIDERRQHWSAGCGIPAALQTERGGPRRESFCTHAVEGRAPLIVQNASDNPIFVDNLLVLTQNLRFYAGVPVLTLFGEAVGTLCILDYQPRAFSHNDLRLLELMTRRASAEIGRRERQLSVTRALPPDDYGHIMDAETGAFARAAFMELVGIEAARRIERQQPLSLGLIEIAAGTAQAIVRSIEGAFSSGWVGRLSPVELGFLSMGSHTDQTALALRNVAGETGRIAVIDLTGRLASGLDLVRLLSP